jgi:hypothetical protein
MVIKSATGEVTVSIDEVCKALLPDHQVWARKYQPNADGSNPPGDPAFFIVAVPRNMKLSTGMAVNIGGAVTGALVEACRGDEG